MPQPDLEASHDGIDQKISTRKGAEDSKHGKCGGPPHPPHSKSSAKGGRALRKSIGRALETGVAGERPYERFPYSRYRPSDVPSARDQHQKREAEDPQQQVQGPSTSQGVAAGCSKARRRQKSDYAQDRNSDHEAGAEGALRKMPSPRASAAGRANPFDGVGVGISARVHPVQPSVVSVRGRVTDFFKRLCILPPAAV